MLPQRNPLRVKVNFMHAVLSTGSDALDKIMAFKAEEVAHAKSQLPITELKLSLIHI